VTRDPAQVFRRWAELWNRRELDTGLSECIHPEVDWRPISVEGTCFAGHDGIRAWAEHLFGDWETFELHPEEIRDIEENRLLALGHWCARARGSGLAFERQHASWLCDFRDGKIVRLETFTDREAALEAAGLEAT
jgi:ketosteroid isomerase-like protein